MEVRLQLYRLSREAAEAQQARKGVAVHLQRLAVAEKLDAELKLPLGVAEA